MRVVVYFDRPGPQDPPFDNPDYVEGYKLLAGTVATKGGSFAIARGRSSILPGGRFRSGWVYRDGAFAESDGELTADVVYNKGDDYPYDEPGVRVVNCRALHELCSKDRTYARFPDLIPVSILVTGPEEVAAAVARIPSALAVVKPTDDACGRGVFIGKPEEIADHLPGFPLVVQEFVDTSGGIPGVTPGLHDLRITLIGGTHALTFVRIPKEGSYLANISQGGSAKLLEMEQVPQDALDLALGIDAELSDLPDRVYCVDMGRDPQGRWKLIELNSPPGLPYPRWGTLARRHYELLSELLLRAA